MPRWGDKQNGPDWTDVMVTMKAIEQLHRVLITITIASTVYDGPAGIITISAFHQPKEASVLGQAVLAISGEYPCKEHSELVHCVFAGLYQLDYELTGKVWQQNKLPFTAD